MIVILMPNRRVFSFLSPYHATKIVIFPHQQCVEEAIKSPLGSTQQPLLGSSVMAFS